jgi:hypothetical protein
MTANRIFVSYSHKDQERCEEFLKHLRAVLGGEERLELWSDSRIEASDDWHREIQAALEDCAVAVCLVSSDFLDSSYINQHELPLLLDRRLRDEIALAPLFLRPCAADTPIRIERSGQETVEARLTQFQGLNTPARTSDALNDHHRELLFLHAARQVRDLALDPGGLRAKPTPGPGQRRELLIHLEPREDTLLRTFSRPDWPDFAVVDDDARSALAEVADWQPGDAVAPGEALFELLFGQGESPSRILLDAFAIDAGEAPNPTYDALRIRVLTCDPRLRALPWTRIEWAGHELRENDWTVELLPPDDESGFSGLSAVRLMMPGQVLCILPETARGAKDATAHWQGLTDFFQNAWPEFARPPVQAATPDEVRQALERQAPRIVYYFGPAQIRDGRCRLILSDGKGGSAPLDLDTLTEWIPQAGTAVVFLNLLGDDVHGAGAHVHGLSAKIPFVAVQSAPSNDTFAARAAALKWLRDALTGQSQTDPVWALHRYGLPTATACSRYRDWYTELSPRPVEERLAELLLDRRPQRERVTDLLDDLVRERTLRVCQVLAYGGPGNSVDAFATQVLKHLKRRPAKSAHVFQKDLRLPLSATTEDAIDRAYRRGLGLGAREPALAALAPRRKHSSGSPYVPLLVWKSEGAAAGEQLAQMLPALVRWVVQNLARPAPAEIHVLSLLALEVPESEVQALEAATEDLSTNDELMDATFELEILQALDHVHESDLRRFIGRESACPPKLRAKLPGLIFRRTGGQFEKTVELLERGKASEWYDLYEDLNNAPPPGAPSDET